MKKITCSTIIVTYNSAPHIKECLSALKKALKGIKGEIIVIDNASTDETVKILKKIKGITLKASKKNKGFTGGVNQGLKLAQGEYVFLLNPDTEVEVKTIAGLIETLKKKNEVAIAAPRLVYPDKKTQSNTGWLPTFSRELVQLTPWYKKTNRGRVRMPQINKKWFTQDHMVEWVSGGAMMIRKDALQEVRGKLDRRYFMYLEDVDLCHQMIDAGWDIAFCGTLSVEHVHSASFNGRYTRANLFEAQSLMQYLGKWHPEQKKRNTVIRVLVKTKLLIKILLLQADHTLDFSDYFAEWKKI